MYRFREAIASSDGRATSTTGAIALGLMLVMLALRITAVLAAPGDFDSSFNGSGAVKIDFSGNEQATDLVVQPGGKILVAGFTTTSSDAAVFRLNPNGSFDTGFSGDGKRAISSGGTERAYALALQPNGKILVAGFTSAGATGKDATVYRLNANGSFDTSFSGDGKRLINSRGNERASALALQSDGKIVVAGLTSAGDTGKDATVYRLKANGSFDKSFSGDGKRLIDLGGDEAAEALAVQSDGKILVAGFTSAGNTGKDATVFRLNANGNFNTSFSGDGKRLIDIAGNEAAFALALQPDGKILVAGSTSGGDTGKDATVHRLNPNGSFDVSFNGGGRLIDSGGDEAARALILQLNGKILVAGYTTAGRQGSFSVVKGNDAAVYRLTANGSFDTSFDGDGAGQGEVLIDSAGDEAAHALGLQLDGKILVAGYTSAGVMGDDAAVYRLLGDPGIPPSTFSQLPGPQLPRQPP